MYENTNQQAILEIAQGNMKSHKLRNAMAVLAIMLTTLLITVVCTVGVSFYETMERGSDLAPGPLADGGIKADISKYEELKKDEEVEWAGYVRPCNLGNLHNQEMVGIVGKLFVPDEVYLEKNKIVLEKGRFPENEKELVISNTLASRLGLADPVGEHFVLRPVILENGKQKEIETEMTITGVYTSPMELLHTVYEEMYTAESFLSETAPELMTEEVTLYTKLVPGKGENYDRLEALSQKIGGSGIIYKSHNNMSLEGIFLAAGFLLLIMVCGYLIIYNIFYISLVNDIRFFGMLKTIGTTGTQVKKILSWQVRRLSAAGIVLGIAAGYLVGLVAAPAVMAQTNYADFYEMPVNPLEFGAAAVFAALTVWVSCRKSYRMAVKISPVEAARYTGKGKRVRQLWSVCSFAISGVIFLVVYTGTMGYDVEKMVERYHTADARISQETMEFGSEEEYSPVSKELVQSIRELLYVENVSCYYRARLDTPGEIGAKDGKIPMKKEGKWKSEWENIISWQRDMLAELGQNPSVDRLRKVMEDENGNPLMEVSGMPVDELAREAKNIRVVEGLLDEEKFATGNYILYNQMDEHQQDGERIHAGDVLPITLYDPQRGEYVTVEKEVMAVFLPANQFAASMIRNANIVFPDHVFMEIFPEYEKWISGIQIDSTGELTKEQYLEIRNLVQGTFNSQLKIEFRYETRVQQQETRNSMTMIGLFLAAIFGMIGIANVVNTLVTGVMTRKQEYAAMQSVGMTKKQMCKSLIGDGLKLAGISTAAAILISATLGRTLLKQIDILTGFSATEFGRAVGILVLVLVVMTVSVAGLLTEMLNKKPVMERLREAE